MRGPRSPWLGSTAFAAILLASGSAAAQENGDVAGRRRALIDEARAASAAGDHARAFEIAGRADALRSSPSLRQFIASEEVSLGRFADALQSASRCVSDAIADPATPHRDRQIAACRTIMEDMRPRVAQVVVRTSASIPNGIEIQLAGRAMGATAFGVPQPVMPGPVLVEAHAPGYRPFAREFTLGAGASIDVDVALELEVPASRVETRAPVPTRGTGAPSRVVTRPLSAGSFVVMGLGGATLVGALVLGLMRNAAIADFEQRYGCTEDVCTDPAGASRVSSLYPLNTATNVTLIAGSALVGVGLVWLVVDAATRTHLEVRPTAQIAPGVVSFGLGGTL